MRRIAVLLGVFACVAAEPADPVAATVNGEPIKLSDVDAVLRRMPPVTAPLTTQQVHDLRAAVADDLIDELVLKQHLRKHGPKPDPAELDAHLKGLEAAQRKLGRTLADYYRETGQTEAVVKERWASLISFQKLVDAQSTDAALRAYHAANKPFFDQVTVRVSHVVRRVGPAAPPAERADAVEAMKRVRAEIAGGTLTFAAAARKYSACPSAAKGGDLGYVARKDSVVDDELARAAFDLKPGEVSQPVTTAEGVHLVIVTDRTAGKPARYEDVIDAVRDCYADDVRQELVTKLRARAEVKMTVP